MKTVAKTGMLVAIIGVLLAWVAATAFAGEPNPAPITEGDDPEEYIVPPDEELFPDDGEILPAGAVGEPEGALPDEGVAGADAAGLSGGAGQVDEVPAYWYDNQSTADGVQAQAATEIQDKFNSESEADSRSTNQDPPPVSLASDDGLTLNSFTLALLVIAAAAAAILALGARQLTSRLRHN